jgi:hypothetical protein
MAREDFRRGVLYGFASMGLTPEEVGDLLIKTAEGPLSAASGIGSSAINALTGAAVGIPLAAGALGGAGAYSLFGPDYKANIGALRTQDIINEIRQRKRDMQRQAAQQGAINA